MRTTNPAEPAARRVLDDRYELERVIGRGGMGVVWRGRDRLLERPVAIKEVVLPSTLPESERRAAQVRVMREARAAARLGDPGVVTVFDVLPEADSTHIVMELIEAPTLEELVRRAGPLSAADAATIGLGVLHVLRAAHAKGIVHRDIKPANVMVQGNCQVKVGDFGVARMLDDPRITTTGVTVGSPSYMSPEQATGSRSAEASDLWSLGATLYFAVEGVSPFLRRNPVATLAAVVNDEPRPPARSGPLAPVVRSLLAKDPSDRPTAEELERLLEAVAREPEISQELTQRVETIEREHAEDWFVPETSAPEAAEPEAPGEPAEPSEPSGRQESPGPADPPEPAQLSEPADPSEPLGLSEREAPFLFAEPVQDDGFPPPEEDGDGGPERLSARLQRERHRRRRWGTLAAVAAAVLALAAVVAWFVVLARGTDTGSRAAPSSSTARHRASPGRASPRGATTRSPRSPTATARPEPSRPPATGTGPAVPSPAAPSPSLVPVSSPLPGPAGWTGYTDPATGYRAAYPAGWEVVRRGGNVTDFQDPSSGAYFRVETDPPAPGTPQEQWEAYSTEFAARHEGYHEIGITPTTFRGHDASLWEFTYGGGVTVHAVDLRFATDAYDVAVFFQTTESDWEASAPTVERFARAFRPPA